MVGKRVLGPNSDEGQEAGSWEQVQPRGPDSPEANIRKV